MGTMTMQKKITSVLLILGTLLRSSRASESKEWDVATRPRAREVLSDGSNGESSWKPRNRGDAVTCKKEFDERRPGGRKRATKPVTSTEEFEKLKAKFEDELFEELYELLLSERTSVNQADPVLMETLDFTPGQPENGEFLLWDLKPTDDGPEECPNVQELLKRMNNSPSVSTSRKIQQKRKKQVEALRSRMENSHVSKTATSRRSQKQQKEQDLKRLQSNFSEMWAKRKEHLRSKFKAMYRKYDLNSKNKTLEERRKDIVKAKKRKKSRKEGKRKTTRPSHRQLYKEELLPILEDRTEEFLDEWWKYTGSLVFKQVKYRKYDFGKDPLDHLRGDHKILDPAPPIPGFK